MRLQDAAIAVLVDGRLEHDSRVQRQLEFLSGASRLVCIARSDSPVKGVDYRVVRGETPTFLMKAKKALLTLRKDYDRVHDGRPYVIEAKKILEAEKFDLIVANDIDTLPLAVKTAADTGCKVLFDAHEWAPGQFSDRIPWRIFIQPYVGDACRKYIPFADAMITVCESVAKMYERDYGVRTEVITNAPQYEDRSPSPLTGNGTEIDLVYHGALNRNRKIETMLDAIELLPPNYRMNLILINHREKYARRLSGIYGRRCSFLVPVGPKEIIGKINGFDIGLFLVPPVNVNLTYTLPNKIFEYIQARLAVVVGPSPEMAAVVRRYDIGEVADDFSAEAFAKAISRMSPARIAECKANTAVAALEFCAEKNREKFLKIVERVLEGA